MSRSYGLRDALATLGLAPSLLAAGVAMAGCTQLGADKPCAAEGEPIHWVADYCMLKLETDDEIAASDCIDEESRKTFPSRCAGNLHFKKHMCEAMIRNGTRTGAVDECLADPTFKGRIVEAGGVGS